MDLFWLRKHHRYGANLRVVSVPPWAAEMRPGCEHDANAAFKIGIEAEEHLLLLVDLGREKFWVFPAVVMGYKNPKAR